MDITRFGIEKDRFIMAQAIRLAQKAAACGEIPVGAVVVSAAGEIIGTGYNLSNSLNTQRAHAEMIALEDAAQAQGDWRLTDCWLFVTLEPCAMCLALARLSRIAGIVYGAPSRQFGACLDMGDSSSVYQVGSLRVVSGISSEESARELQKFFQKKRGTSE